MPTISIIIPVYGTERYLRRCLDSVLHQTFSDWEAICVNDGSPDDSATILIEYAARDERFKFVDKPNGGLSDARNAGMKQATGEYIVFLDSDDLIHPQTFEISYALAQRDQSDIVSWYKDPLFRPELLIRYKLGQNIDSRMPRAIHRRYQLDNVQSYVTDDVFAHVTEVSSRDIQWPIKHFYVWRHLLRRELIEDIPFLKGVNFEDFPWWSEVILRNPRVTITHLPFYYYFPNFTSIDLASKRAAKIGHWVSGMEHTWPIYQSRATDYQRSQWLKHCFWPVLRVQILRKLPDLTSPEVRDLIRARLQRLWDDGAFASPPDASARRSQRRLARFLEEQG